MTFPTLVFGFGGPGAIRTGLTSNWSVPTSPTTIPLTPSSTSPEGFDRTGGLFSNNSYTASGASGLDHSISLVIQNTTGNAVNFTLALRNNGVIDQSTTISIAANSTQTITVYWGQTLPNGNVATLTGEAATASALTINTNSNTFWSIYKRR